MAAYTFRMPSGVQGDISRRQSTVVDQFVLNTSLPFPTYGVPGKIVSGKLVPLVAGDTADLVAAFLVREYPTTGVNASDALGAAVPKTHGNASGMIRGYMTVKNNAGTPALERQVYVRVGNAAGAKVIGGLEAAFESSVAGVAGSNTGNGTIGTLSSTSVSVPGVYAVTMLTATTFKVVAPGGVRLVDGATGSAYTADGVTFTITVGGTPMIAGDSFAVTNTHNTIAIANCVFQDAGDADGNVEISYKM